MWSVLTNDDHSSCSGVLQHVLPHQPFAFLVRHGHRHRNATHCLLCLCLAHNHQERVADHSINKYDLVSNEWSSTAAKGRHVSVKSASTSNCDSASSRQSWMQKAKRSTRPSISNRCANGRRNLLRKTDLCHRRQNKKRQTKSHCMKTHYQRWNSMLTVNTLSPCNLTRLVPNLWQKVQRHGNWKTRRRHCLEVNGQSNSTRNNDPILGIEPSRHCMRLLVARFVFCNSRTTFEHGLDQL